MLTIGIVLYNEEKQLQRVEQNLKVLKKYGLNPLLVDNASQDSSPGLLKKMSESLSVPLLVRTENNLGAARADVVNVCQDPWVGFIDGDCTITESWAAAVARLTSESNARPSNSSSQVAAVGGALWPGGLKRELYRRLFQSFLGNINSTQVKDFKRSGWVLHLPTANVIYRRDILLAIGNFDVKKDRVGEDLDISYRLRAQGYQLRVDETMGLTHQLPESFTAWIQKVFNYGKARGLVGFEQRVLFSYPFLLPLVFAIFIAVSVLMNLVLIEQWRAWPLALYALYVLGHALVYGGVRFGVQLFGYFIAMHGAYSLGLWYGVALGLGRRPFQQLMKMGTATHR